MNLVSSIHDVKEDPILETLIETEVERFFLADVNVELHSTGFFDGLLELNAKLLCLEDYWQEHQIGYREYCCASIGVEIPPIRTLTVHQTASMVSNQKLQLSKI